MPPPAEDFWASLHGVIDKLVALLRWWKELVALGAVIYAIYAAHFTWVVKPRRCSASLAPIREAATYADWPAVSAQIPKWEQNCRDCSRELDLEVDMYKARSELWAGRISRAKVILDEIRGRPADSSPLRARVDYVDTVLARATGKFSEAHDCLSDLLPAKRIDPLPDDVLFDVLYDLTVLEMRLDDPSQTKKRLSEVKNATGNDKMRILRAVLLEGMISYTHGEVSECVNLLRKIEFDRRRAPAREGLRLFYLAACLEELGESDQARKPRNDAEEYLSTGGNQWEWLAMRAHKIHRELDALDRKINRSFYTQDKAGAVAAISQAIEDADADLARLRKPAKDHVSIPTESPIPWIHLRLKLLEAQLTLLKFKLQKPADEGALRKVSGDIKPLLQQAEDQELVLFQVWCHFALAQLAIIEEDDSKVTSHYQTAKDLAEKAGLPQEAARAMLKRAEFHKQIECPCSCREDILGAIAIFETSGNSTWVVKLKDYLNAGGCSPAASQDDDREPNSSSSGRHP